MGAKGRGWGRVGREIKHLLDSIDGQGDALRIAG